MRVIKRIAGILLVSLGALRAGNDVRDFLEFEWMYSNAWVNIQHVAFCAVWALLILTGIRMWRKPIAGIRGNKPVLGLTTSRQKHLGQKNEAC
jgi:hypothetical protein